MGLGGLSLGLKASVFSFVMGNELSPMAAESYAFNLLREDLLNSQAETIKKTLWLPSAHPKSKLENHLRENPFNFPNLGGGYCDLKPDGTNLDNAFVVGWIVELNNWLNANPTALSAIRSGFDHGTLDLVSGGSP